MARSSRFARALARLYPARIDRGACAEFIQDALDDRRSGRRAFSSLTLLLARDLVRAHFRSDHERPASALAFSMPVLSSRSHLMHRLLNDVRFALRVLRRTPAFTAVALLVLSLGIGATTAVYAVFDTVLLRPYGYRDMDRIMILLERTLDGQAISVSWPNFQDWRAEREIFEELGVYRGVAVTLTGEGGAERVTGHMVSSSVFATIGIPPLAGRVFSEEDDKSGPGQTVIISERLWRSRFGSADIVGKPINFGTTPYTVVGIMPASMRFPSRLTDIWLPLGGSVASFPASRGAHPGLIAVGRLKKGLSLERAQSAMTALGDRLAKEYPDTNALNRIRMTPYYETIVQDIRPTLYAVLGAVSLLLIMACTNLAGLMIARAEQRHRELVVRSALGAGRAHLVRQLLAEAAILGLGGGALGVSIAYGALRLFVASEPGSIPRVDQLGIDWRVATFAVLISFATVMCFGLLPAIRAASPDLRGALQHLRTGAGPKSVRVRRLVVGAQMAMAVLLLVGAGLLGKTIAQLMSIDLGFEPDRVVTARFSLSPVAYPTVEAWTSFHATLLEKVAALPGVSAVGLDDGLALQGGGSESSIRKEGDPPAPPTQPPTMSLFQSVSPGYFKAMNIPLIRGRGFDERDRDGSVRVAVVDQTLVDRMFPGEDPIGKRVSFEGDRAADGKLIENWREIVGVVGHVKFYGLTANRPFVQIYVPYTQLPIYFRDRRPTMALFVKTSGAPEASVTAIRNTLAGMDPRMPLYGVRTMEQYIMSSIEQPRLSAALLTGFAAVALTLALVGVYGVLAYTVSQRTREIGVRIALGAGRGQIIRGVVWDGARLSIAGVVLGLALAWPATRYIQTLLYNVSPGDAGVFSIAAAGLLLTAIAASWLPARRASAVQPVVALRGD